MIEFLSGALVLAFAIAGLHFLKLWRLTRDRLFLHFAIAFWLFALNEVAVSTPRISDDLSGYEYLLRVLGLVQILMAIADKTLSPPPVPKPDPNRHGPVAA